MVKFAFLIILIVIMLSVFWVLLARDFNTVGKIMYKIIKPFKNKGEDIDE